MPEKAIIEILKTIGEDPEREGLVETPKRVVESMKHLYSGYKEDPKRHLKKQFVMNDYNGMVVMKNIELYSMCEHHLLPFTGICHICYIPNGKVFGASKLARLMEGYARRAQIQERLTKQIADAIEEAGAKGVMVIIEAKHHCMCSRGVGKQNSVMVTSDVRGAFKQNYETRMEGLALIKM